MSQVTCDLSMSLDGFHHGPHTRPEAPIGDDDGRLHAWMAGGLMDYRAGRREETGTAAAVYLGDNYRPRSARPERPPTEEAR